MRAVFQRVSSAEVRSDGRVTGSIGPGAVILLGVGKADTEAEAVRLADKVTKLRVFDDAEGRMNLPISSVPDGKFIVVSQFTLAADTSRGNRPGFSCRWRKWIHWLPEQQCRPDPLFLTHHEFISTGGPD